MGLEIYNTLTRRQEPFEPVEEGKVRMYVCGPTVYAPAHIGNFRTNVVNDVIRRLLELEFGPDKVSWNFDALELYNGKRFELLYHYRIPEVLPPPPIPDEIPRFPPYPID